jgi:hypothetical protein
MRLTARWLLLVIIAPFFADAFTVARMPNDCCCAGMSKGACPLKQRGRLSCDDHGRAHCSLNRPDAGTAAQYRRSLESRHPSTLTQNPIRVWTPSVALSFEPASDPHPNALDRSPEIPPPRAS